MDFTIYDDGGVESFLAGLDKEDRRGGRPLPPDVEEDLKVRLLKLLWKWICNLKKSKFVKEVPVGEAPAPDQDPVMAVEMDVEQHSGKDWFKR